MGVFGGLTGRETVDSPRLATSDLGEQHDTAAVRTSGRKPCETTAAYAHHFRRGETACDACREAQRLKSAEAHAKRRERAQQAGGARTSPRPPEPPRSGSGPLHGDIRIGAQPVTTDVLWPGRTHQVASRADLDDVLERGAQLPRERTSLFGARLPR